mgnify:CR=1 FL=1
MFPWDFPFFKLNFQKCRFWTLFGSLLGAIWPPFGHLGLPWASPWGSKGRPETIFFLSFFLIVFLSIFGPPGAIDRAGTAAEVAPPLTVS